MTGEKLQGGVRGARRQRAVVVALGAGLIALVAGGLAAGGPLAYKDCFANNGRHGCKEPTHNSLRAVVGVTTSPDGTSVYAASYVGAVTTFKREANGALVYVGCIANAGADGCTAPAHDSLLGAIDIAVSPDGRSVYVASEDEPGGPLSIFNRAADGSISYAGCFAEDGQHGCATPTHGSLASSHDVAVSPDGESVYVVGGFRPGALNAFDRAPDGSLTYAGCFASHGGHGCSGLPRGVLKDAYGLALSPDGRSMYVGSLSDSAIAGFQRASDGTVTYSECFANRRQHGCKKPRHNSLESANALAVSPEGKSLYVASQNAVTRFQRKSNGSLVSKGCFASAARFSQTYGCRKAPRGSLEAGSAVVVSPNGRSVYSAGLAGPSLNGGPGAIVRFRRGPKGAIKYRRCYVSDGKRGCKRLPHLSIVAPQDLDMSADGQSLYVAASGSLARFTQRRSSP